MNEYSRLKMVIVGRENFKMSFVYDKHFKEFYKTRKKFSLIKHFREKIKYLNDRKLYLDNLSKILIDNGIKVIRPDITDDFIDSNIRDFAIVLDNIIIIAPTFLETRRLSYLTYLDVLKKLNKPILYPILPTGNILQDNYSYNILDGVTQFEKNYKNYFPLFDAANILKCDEGLIFNISNHNEYAGYIWLKQQIKIEIFPVFLDNSHIDGALNIVNENLILLCYDFVIPKHKMIELLPPFLRYKKIIHIDKAYDDSFNIASIGGMFINILSIDNNTVIIDEEAKYVIQELNKEHIKTIPIKVAGSRLFGGGIHCTTLDIERV
jgi:N-dimethylarginine dimethylaminohydrolase